MEKDMKKVVITGAAGIIGTVLRKGLKDFYNLTLLDKVSPEKGIIKIDLVKDLSQFEKILKGKDIILHLAWERTKRRRRK
jgi:nucleoside-diphosphate-sugar epimerase